MTTKLGALIIDVEGLELTPEEREILAHPLVGGVVLFARNYASRQQLTSLCQSIRATRQTPLLIMVDQEGGRVQRFINEFTRLPYLSLFGHLYDTNPERACALVRDSGWLMAMELLTAGIDMSLAPVLDLNKGISTVIGERAFHAEPTVVIELAKSYMMGMNEAGMAATGKHFPGHGSVKLDSHVAKPVDNRALEQVEGDDMVPFAALVKQGIQALMASHIVFPAVDELPVGYSKCWLQTILRDQLGFKGIILSDDLKMEGANISANYSDRVVLAREAGCDLALLCNHRVGVIEVLDRLSYTTHCVGIEKWGALKSRYSPVNKPLIENPRWQQISEFLLKNNA